MLEEDLVSLFCIVYLCQRKFFLIKKFLIISMVLSPTATVWEMRSWGRRERRSGWRIQFSRYTNQFAVKMK